MSSLPFHQAGLAKKMQRLAALLGKLNTSCGRAEDYLEAGRICLQVGENRRAFSLLEAGCRRFPDNWQCFKALVQALAAKGQVSRARRLCLEYLQVHPHPNDLPKIVALLMDLEKDPAGRQADITLEGFASDPDRTFIEIASHALLPYGPSREQLEHWQRFLQRRGSRIETLAAMADSGEFKKQAVSWFVCGNVRRFLEANLGLWSKNPWPGKGPRPSGRYILTSFLHPDPTNKVRNGLVAKYIQHLTGCPILAVGSDDHYRKLHGRLAASFRMETYHHLREPDSTPPPEMTVPQSQGPALRRWLLQLSAGGIQVGDLIYDQYLRRLRRPTIESPDDKLNLYIYRARSLVQEFENLFRHYPIAYVVVDHLVYLRWGILARMGLARGATVISHHGRSSPLMARIHHPGNGLPEYEARFERRDFEALFGAMGTTMAARGYEIVRRYYLEKRPHKHTLVDGKHNRRYDRRQLLAALGMDPGLPTVFIMAHTMTDAPHMLGRLLFDDYYQWLKATLEMAVRIPKVNWIVKEHPFAKVYTDRNDALEMAATYASKTSNIRACPMDFHPGGLLDCADALVTARGTAGLEGAVFGKPCVLAGRSAYSGHGFTIDPATVADYHRELQALVSPRPLSDQAVTRARAYAYLFFEACRIPCSLLPELPLVALDPLPDDIQWQLMADRLKAFKPHQDPLYLNLKRAFQDPMPYLLEFGGPGRRPGRIKAKGDKLECSNMEATLAGSC